MNTKHAFPFIDVGKIRLLLLIGCLSVADTVSAQEGSSGNTTIFNGAQMTFFGDHNFTTGGGGTQPGVINTIRTAPFGVLNFSPSANVSVGGDDANYVDGYVRKYGTSPFIFPVGDNAHYGPFAAQGDGTTGSYYFADPTSAVTSMLPSGNYPILPSGGPFPSATFETALEAVSTIEYWDIDGSNATPLTLTWDATSAISTLTNAELAKLTIAGWDGAQWVAIPSKVDVTSILGGTSDLTAGSITTAAALAPDTYTAYTFASRDTPLPVTLVAFTTRLEGAIALLNWSTTDETNSDHFEIERSGNAKSWEKIGIVKSQGESRVLVHYDFVDPKPESGPNFYRLKMVDYDGTFAYSRIRSLEIGQDDSWRVYPNPVADKLYLKDPALVSKIRILNNSGTVVYQSGPIISQELNVATLNPGLHVVETTFRNGTKTNQKVVVRK